MKGLDSPRSHGGRAGQWLCMDSGLGLPTPNPWLFTLQKLEQCGVGVGESGFRKSGGGGVVPEVSSMT